MNCPQCQAKSRVTRTAGTTRYRVCPKGHSFKTIEVGYHQWHQPVDPLPPVEIVKEIPTSLEESIRTIVREELGCGNDA